MILGQAIGFYIATVLIFIGVDLVAAWGFDMQYGTTRVINLSFITSQAMGAYFAAMLTIGRPNASLGATYLFGARLPFPIPWVGGAAAGALFSFLVGVVLLPRIQDEYFAIVSLVIGVGMLSLVSAYVPLFNGEQGLYGVPLPFSSSSVPTSGALWVMVGLTAAVVVIAGLVVWPIQQSPLSRRLRAIRDNEMAASAIGIPPLRIKLMVIALGGAFGGASGVLLVNAFGSWGTGSWQLPELIFVLTAVVVGGSGNILGVALGVIGLIVALGQVIQFIPGLQANSTAAANLQAAVISVLEIIFFWVRPGGIVPERVHRTRVAAPVLDDSNANSQVVTAHTRIAAVARYARHDTSYAPKDTTAGPGQEAVPALAVEHLTVRFGGIFAVRDCSFEVRRRAITCLVGPNGAGKSTVISAVAGTVRPQSGRIRLGGRILAGPPEVRVRHGVGRTFQLPQEFGTMTVLENVMVALPESAGSNLRSVIFQPGRWRRSEHATIDQAMEILGACGLGSMLNEQARTLSGGQKKLLELARALACRPTLLLLDEPTAGVSPHLHAQITDILLGFPDHGLTVVVISHEMTLVRLIADDVVVMADGAVLCQGSFDNVSQNAGVQAAYLGRQPMREEGL
jgi:ABC-type branched-subunit amino acid transport system ATPase component/ABC-type branched-subunit amino acid transport system permease subunit